MAASRQGRRGARLSTRRRRRRSPPPPLAAAAFRRLAAGRQQQRSRRRFAAPTQQRPLPSITNTHTTLQPLLTHPSSSGRPDVPHGPVGARDDRLQRGLRVSVQAAQTLTAAAQTAAGDGGGRRQRVLAAAPAAAAPRLFDLLQTGERRAARCRWLFCFVAERRPLLAPGAQSNVLTARHNTIYQPPTTHHPSTHPPIHQNRRGTRVLAVTELCPPTMRQRREWCARAFFLSRAAGRAFGGGARVEEERGSCAPTHCTARRQSEQSSHTHTRAHSNLNKFKQIQTIQTIQNSKQVDPRLCPRARDRHRQRLDGLVRGRATRCAVLLLLLACVVGVCVCSWRV